MDKQTESREQFETWMAVKFSRPDLMLRRLPDGGYSSHYIDMRWEAWQASRESLVVDIDWPEANDDHWKDGEEGAYAQGYELGKDLTAIKVKQSLRAIGIRIKGEGV